MHFHVVLAVILATLSIALSRIVDDRYYTAAVYEHKLLGDADGGLKANIEYYERATRLAKQQGADIIVFPEYGLVPLIDNRTLMREKLEEVPDPKKTMSNPCVERESFRNHTILTALSCMARESGVIVVANMGGLETCPDMGCPEDGVLQLNTNVAFDSNGTLLARYYKEHLYYEMSMDLPRVAQDPLFHTEFGTFAMFICFDMVYGKMAETARLADVDAVLFSTMWFNSLPFFTATQWFQAWATGNDVTLLAANIQVPGHALSGSGIFRGRHGPTVLTQNPDGESKLLVSTLPRRGFEQDFQLRTQRTAILENGTGDVREDGQDVPMECDHKRLGWTENLYSEFRCFSEDVSNYTLAKVKGREGNVSVCHKGMCCQVVYSAEDMEETFYVGVSNSTSNSSGHYLWAEENCFFARCDDQGDRKCVHFPTQSTTLFRQLSLTANFTTDYVYPSLVSSALRLVPTLRWNFTGPAGHTSGIKMFEGEGVSLLMATLKGRPYERDPPFIR